MIAAGYSKTKDSGYDLRKEEVPTIFKKDGFRVVIYPNDHEPAHVHIHKSGSEIKVDALTMALMSAKGPISKKDIRKAIKMVKENQSLVLEKWSELHG